MAKSKGKRTKRSTAKKQTVTPLASLTTALNSFLNDLDCAAEVFEVVDPVLEKQDQERHHRIKEFVEGLEKAKGNRQQETEYFERGFKKFLAAARKLGRGHALFQTNTFVALVSRFDELVGDIIRGMHKAYPDRLKSCEKSLTYEEIIRLTELGQAVDCIIDKEVDKVLRDSHTAQIQYIERQLGIKVRDQLAGWSKFIELTERRNLLVHTGGTVSPQYLKVCKANGASLPAGCKEGARLGVDRKYFESAHRTLYEVGLKLAQGALRNLFPKDLESIDRRFIDHGVELMSEERWDIAKMYFEYATSLAPDQTFDDQTRKILLVNRAIALKFSGEKETSKRMLDQIDWSSANVKFTLAVHVLRDEFSAAEKVMSSMNGKDPIDEEGFRTWPLFREFRKSDHFRRAFKKIYGKEFDQLDTARQIQQQISAEPDCQSSKPAAPNV